MILQSARPLVIPCSVRLTLAAIGGLGGLVVPQAAAQLVAYSNLGPGDGFDKRAFIFEPVCTDAIISGFGFACLPEHSGVLGTIELALRNVEGTNQWIVGLGEWEWPVVGLDKPGDKLAKADVSGAGIIVTAGEYFFVSIRHVAPCCDGADAKARWYSNNQGAEMFAGLEVVVQACGDGEITYQGVEGAEPAIRLTLQSVCVADFTGDAHLDLFDFLGFVNAFNAGDPAADGDQNGVLDLFDFLAFVNAFNEGC